MIQKQDLSTAKTKSVDNDTIVAIATPPGRGGVAIIRISGINALPISEKMAGKINTPRKAYFRTFIDEKNKPIDQGVALYFKGPHSFTGEDVVELHGHGGPVVMDCLLRCTLSLGARMAKPGEFSLRAYLNDKIDLTQAEAIADLIDASSVQSAQGAMRSLQGDFSKKINELLEALIHLRMMVEAAIDFPEEEIDFLAESDVGERLNTLIEKMDLIFHSAEQGALIREGMTVVIAGKPNAGKSSLLNALSGKEAAIVTDVAGTTRDVLRESIHIDGMPLHIIDTAGLRETEDLIEKEGVRRTKNEIEKADVVLLMIDINTCTDIDKERKELLSHLPEKIPTITLINKIDQQGKKAAIEDDRIEMSVKENQGIDLLREKLKNMMGYQAANEGQFTARRRHLSALEKTMQHLNDGAHQLETHRAGELLAEDLRQAQNALSEITGEFTSDDLLGKIFSSFCIGK